MTMSPAAPYAEEAMISASLERIVDGQSCRTWATPLTFQPGDIILVNNSFLHRHKIATSKSDLLVGLRLTDVSRWRGDVVVVESRHTNPFTKLEHRNPRATQATPLSAALASQRADIGRLVFLLVGELDDSLQHEAEVASSGRLRRVVLNPVAQAAAALNGDTLVVRDVVDEGHIWRLVHTTLGVPDDDPLQDAILKALRQLDDEAYSRVVIPDPGVRATNSILERLVAELRGQYQRYGTALDRYRSNGQDEDAYTEILRIAYNFAGDAVKLIRLCVSICDLKPVVGWCTLAEHLALSEAFQALPLIGSKARKPGLDAYVQAISAARNSRFHDLFPFKRAVHIGVPGAAIRNAELRLFSKYASKTRVNRLEFEDQELVDLLTEFTRAGHRDVSLDFWEANANVMRAALNVLRATQTALERLNS